MGNAPQLMGVGTDFLERTSTQELRTTVNKWTLINPKSFYTAKEILEQVKNNNNKKKTKQKPKKTETKMHNGR